MPMQHDHAERRVARACQARTERIEPTIGRQTLVVDYEYELKTGERHRTAEFMTVRGGKLLETQVCFGGRV